jgi:pilus assembly protein CpaF
MINGPFNVWVEQKGNLKKTGCAFPSREALDAVLTNIAQFIGQPLGEERPILEAHLPDGSRVEAVLPPVAEAGPVVSIRRFSRSVLTIKHMIAGGTIPREGAKFLAHAVRAKKNIIVSGGTGSGKTSLLSALSSFVSDRERVVVIEDTRELRLPKSHVVYLEARSADHRGRGQITIRDLLRATLRLRPDRIVVGEVRGAEALDLIQAMNTGHAGSLTTAHANSPLDALRRLETMALMADTGLPLHALRAQIASAVDFVVQIERTAEGKRQVIAISQVGQLSEGENYQLQPIFARNGSGLLEWVGGRGRKKT